MFNGLRKLFSRRKREEDIRVQKQGEAMSRLFAHVYTMKSRVDELEKKVSDREDLRKLSESCMNRITELHLLATGRDDLAFRFRAEAGKSEREPEKSDEWSDDEWPPKNSSTVNFDGF